MHCVCNQSDAPLAFLALSAWEGHFKHFINNNKSPTTYVIGAICL